MDRKAKPKISDRYSAEIFEDELLLYSEGSEDAFYLNTTAQAVLQLCDGNLTTSEIIEYFQNVYPDQREEIDRHIVEVLTVLHTKGVITLPDD